MMKTVMITTAVCCLAGLAILPVKGTSLEMQPLPSEKMDPALKDAVNQLERTREAIEKAVPEKAARKELDRLVKKIERLIDAGEYEKASLLALSVRLKVESGLFFAKEKKDADSLGRHIASRVSRFAGKAAAPRSQAPKSIACFEMAAPINPPALAHGGSAVPNGQAYDAMFFESYGVNPFVDTDEDFLSTFGLDVDTGSYTLSRKYVFDGHLPPKEAVRAEAFVNYFDYGYAAPEERAFSINLAGARTPFAGEQYRLLRVGLKGYEVKAENRKPATLTFVIDVSGSMNRENRLGLVKKSLGLLLDELDEEDQVGIVIYGSRAEVVLEPTGLEHRRRIRKAIDDLAPGGSTNAEEGMLEAYAMAAEHFRPDAINRIILCSDGVANVGRTSAEDILKQVKDFADRGIMLTVLGFGMGNYNDVMMEKLADKGNGQYAYVDTLPEAERVFVENLEGTLQVVARDAKVQVKFNPDTVTRYRLIGYENRDIRDEDFRNDKVDAGEVGSGHQVTALYEVKLAKHADEGIAAEVFVRCLDPENGNEPVEFSESITVEELNQPLAQAPSNLRLAAAAAEYAEVLRKSFWAKEAKLEPVRDLLQQLPADMRSESEVAELTDLVCKAIKLMPADEAPVNTLGMVE